MAAILEKLRVGDRRIPAKVRALPLRIFVAQTANRSTRSA